MKHNTLRTILSFTALLLSLAAAAPANAQSACSYISVSGKWAFTESGSIILPTGAVPFAVVGNLTFDAAGNVSGTDVSITPGVPSKNVIRGTLTLNPDCTASLTAGVYDESGKTCCERWTWPLCIAMARESRIQ
jgi:spore coat protein U-like protein